MGRTERWPRLVVSIGPYLVLAIVAIFAVVDGRGSGTDVAVDLALLALLGVWMLGVFTLHPGWHAHPVAMAVFVVVVFAIVTVLVAREPWFGALAIVGYIYSFAVVPWAWRMLAVAAFAVLAATAQASGVPKDTAGGLVTYAAIIGINVIALCVFTWIHWSSGAVSEQRRQALEENSRLHEQLVEQAREAGILEERQRMAREIHDTLAQGLVGIVTQLQAADQSGGNIGEQRRHLAAAETLARESLTEARRSVQALRPSALESTSMADAVRDVAHRWSDEHGIAVEATVVGEQRPLDPDAETGLLRAGQEALSNVARHAAAQRVVVTLSYLPDQVILDVRDDGSGFDLAAHGDGGERGDADGGFGLLAMRQRVAALGGTVSVESEPARGTVVSVSIPSRAMVR
ncbi:sensor histidine kinase [Leifsonia sp. NPDC058230]|uniref:sensor histidine kinase n=1 Tax=Leifsonia sp. NPDC058230 TaxID=3346391 RepID=UPI0036DB7E66